MADQLIRIEAKGIEDLQRRLDALGAGAPRAIVRSLSRAQTAVLTRLVRWLVAATGVKSTRLRKSINQQRPTVARQLALINLYGGRAPLIQWGQNQQRQHLPPSAFLARMPGSGHVGYFERTGHARAKRIRPGVWHTLPIREVFGPRWTDVITDVGLRDLLAFGGQRLVETLEREIAYLESQQTPAA